MIRQTLEDQLRAQGQEVPERVACPSCGRMCRPFEIVDVRDTPEIKEDDACSHCLIDAQRTTTAKEEAKEAKRKRPSWDSDAGAQVRAERNRLLDEWAWTVRRGSPLSSACQDQFEAFLGALHRITVDYGSPAQVQWPAIPVLEYQEK